MVCRMCHNHKRSCLMMIWWLDCGDQFTLSFWQRDDKERRQPDSCFCILLWLWQKKNFCSYSIFCVVRCWFSGASVKCHFEDGRKPSKKSQSGMFYGIVIFSGARWLLSPLHFSGLSNNLSEVKRERVALCLRVCSVYLVELPMILHIPSFKSTYKNAQSFYFTPDLFFKL